MTKNTYTILLVDDCLEDREIHRFYLLGQQHSYKVLEASTGEEALLLCSPQSPEVIVMDYFLPDMDGQEFLNYLKTHLGKTNPPVIILTGRGNEQIAVQAMKIGAADYLVKKDTTELNLRLAVENILEKTHLTGQLEESEGCWELERRVQERTIELQKANLDLQITLDELQVVQEQLRSSNEALARSRQAIELERQHYQNLFKFAPDGYLVTDTWGNIREANCAAATLLSIQQQHLIGKPLPILIAEKERKAFRTRLARLKEAQSWEVYFAPRSGEPFPAMVSVSSRYDQYGQQVGWYWLIHNIRDRKQIEKMLQAAHDELEKRVEVQTAELFRTNELLQQKNELLETIFAHVPVMICLFDSNGRFQWANREWEKVLGWCVQEIQGQDLLPELYPDPNYRQHVMDCIAAADQQWNNFKTHTKDGQVLDITWANVCLTDGSNIGIGKDISQSKQAQEKIREQSALLDVTTDAIFVRDLECRILYWNSGAERMYGWLAAEVLGRNCREFLYKERSPSVEEALTTVIEQGAWQGELHKITKSGQEIIVSCRWMLMRDDAGQPKSILAVDTDLTEKKHLEAQSYRTQRLESLGTLASGIAHDLNNILTPILAVAQLLPLKLPNLNEQNQQLLRILEGSSKRGAELVKQILSFGRGTEGKRVPLDPRYLLKEIEQVVNSTFPKSIKICTNLPTLNLWTIVADPTQIHQVLMNLCVNARDAMPDGGTLSLSATNFSVDQNYARMNLEAKVGNYVVITVSDTGCGIPKEFQERIFEPFFTTKELSRGTGLGLSTVFGIVKNHDGFIEVHSEVSRGSQFKIYLPVLNESIAQSVEDVEVIPGNGELILFVDDDTAIQDISKTLLCAQNYRVLTASDGIEAIALYIENQQQIDIVVIDLMMPSLDGITTIRTLRQINPAVKIIAISGLESNKSIAQNQDALVQAFLAKPYTMQELLKTLSSVLSLQLQIA